MALRFPPGFRFGSATSAFQIEGAPHEGGKQDSIWDVFCRVPGAVVNGENADIACDHYHRYADDIAAGRLDASVQVRCTGEILRLQNAMLAMVEAVPPVRAMIPPASEARLGRMLFSSSVSPE